MSVMMNIGVKTLQEIQKKIHSFLWNGKTHGRIAIETLQKDKKDGGLRLVNLEDKQQSLKIQSVLRLESDMLKSIYVEHNIQHINDLIWKCNLDTADIRRIFPNTFFREALEGWSKINYRWLQNRAEVLSEIIWLNSEIKIGGIPVIWNKWIQADILVMQDIVDENGNFKPWPNVEKPGLNWLDYISLQNAVPIMWKVFLTDKNDCHVGRTRLQNSLLHQTKISRPIYDKLIEDGGYIYRYLMRWREEDLPNMEYEQYRKSFKDLYRISKATKLRDFQYCLLLKKLVFNTDLVKWQKKDSHMCNFGKVEPDGLKHIFLDCRYTSHILPEVQRKFDENGSPINIQLENIVLNNVQDSVTHIANYIVLIIKQYIYSSQCLGKNPVGWELAIENIYNFELFESQQEFKMRNHYKKWSNYKPELKRLLNNQGENFTYARQYLEEI